MTNKVDNLGRLQEIIEDKNTKRDKNYAKAVNDAMKKIQGNETTKKKKKDADEAEEEEVKEEKPDVKKEAEISDNDDELTWNARRICK